MSGIHTISGHMAVRIEPRSAAAHSFQLSNQGVYTLSNSTLIAKFIIKISYYKVL